ncbi:Pol polyprotein [Thelohanellus kitauei]|uniref:Pol polyprotein n=1 Tax=Thelohanellus kitauei TaxID=669202 RepID=A0A0C2MWK6_THEKT|nr:Pol polyprotein [Thelohanellus kitauei]
MILQPGVGPLPTCRGYTHLLTCVDRFTRWPEAIPLSDISAESCAKAFKSTWISRFEVPLQITSDRGRQFTSQLWTAMSKLFGTSLTHTSSYHPQANGLVERFHRHLKSSLMARLSNDQWLKELTLGTSWHPSDTERRFESLVRRVGIRYPANTPMRICRYKQ